MKNKYYLFIALALFLVLPSINALTCNSGDISTTCVISSAQSFIDTENFNGTGDLVISAAVSNSTAMKSLTLNFSTIIINGSGSITGGNINIYANNLTLATANSISGNSLGYAKDTGPGKGTLGNGNGDGSSGAGHGGAGGMGNFGAARGLVYGSSLSPNTYGSGGASCRGQSGGSGGGIVTLNIYDTFNLTGTITSNGGAASSPSNCYGSSGGSAGSIYVTTRVLQGSGNVSAMGGTGGNGNNCANGVGGGGSGGRIAMYYNSSTFIGMSASSVVGGAPGAAGAESGYAGSLIFIDQVNNVATMPSGFRFQGVTGIANETTNTTFWNTANPAFYNFSNITAYNSILFLGANVSLKYINSNFTTVNWTCVYGSVYTANVALNITATNFTLDSNSNINLKGCGFITNTGPGPGLSGVGSYGGSGAGHGGAGGNDNDGARAGGSAYGSRTNPLNFGSGGGLMLTAAGGNGGGILILAINNTLILNGTVIVDGAGGNGAPNIGTGGGSGGSIYITTNSLLGTGSLSANGGAGANGAGNGNGWGGGGAGGRIAVYSSGLISISSSLTGGASGGGNAQAGAAGTGFSSYPTYNATGGYDGSGAYYFDGIGDYIQATVTQTKTTYSFWYKNSTATSWTFVVNLNGINYTNGVLGNPGQYPIYVLGNTVQIGITPSGSYFAGYIDDVKILPYTLTAGQVLQLYNGTTNNTAFIGKYINQGNFQSLVFYNSTSTYWNTTLSLADTASSRTGIVNNKNEINTSDPNLVSYWKLDGNFVDAKGVNNGTQIGTNNATGISSSAINFNGVSDYITVASSNNLDFNNMKFTISGWLKTGSSSSGVIISKGYSSVAGGWAVGYNGNKLWASTKASLGGIASNRNSSASVNDNNWHHFVATFNTSTTSSTGNDLSVYIDGVLSQSVLELNGQNYANASGINLDIGARNGTFPNVFFNGTIDEVLIYNKSLSASEVEQLYKSGLSQHATTNVTLQMRTGSSYNVSDPSLVAMYDFNKDDIVIDNDDATKFWTTGSWIRYGDYKGFHGWQLIGNTGASAWAYWNITVPTTGSYDTYIMFGGAGTTNDATNAPFTLSHNQGRTIFAVNENPTGGTWYLLGNFNYTAGQIYNLSLNNSADRRVWADAVLLRPTGSDVNYITDTTGKNNATNYGGLQSGTYGLVGNGYYFNNTKLRDYMVINSTSMLSGVTTLTISAWLNPLTTGTTGVILSRTGTTITGIYQPSAGVYDCRLNGAVIAATPASSIVAGKWRHIACVWSSGLFGKIYLDGVDVTTSPGNTTGTNTQNTQFYIGIDPNFASFFNGYIDEVRIYNRSLSAAEVLDLYNLGATHISDWSAWSSAQTLSDGTPITTSGSGKFMQFQANLNTNDTTVSPYIINYSVVSSSNQIQELAPSVIFNTQTPADISSTNAFAIGVNITYNISDTDLTGLNLTTIQLFYKSNSTTRDCINFINGTCTSGFKAKSYLSNASSTFLWNLDDDSIYPLVSNINPDTFHNTVHKILSLSSSNRFVKTQFLNVTNTTQYNFIEVMVNASISANNLNFFYCNSSYTTGNVNTNNNCVIATTWQPTPLFNYTDNQSKYKLVPIFINATSGTLGGIKVTSTSYFLLQGSGVGGDRYVYYINGGVRVGAVQTTINNGLVWTENNTIIPDMMLHQFSGNSSVYYYACANDTSNPALSNCSATRQDLFDLAGLPPTAPIVYSPVEQTYNTGSGININYTPAISPNDYAISYYNISLLNYDMTFNQTIIGNNSNNLGYFWMDTGISEGVYVISVQAYDSLGQTSIGYSSNFTISNDIIKPIVSIISPANGSTVGLGFYLTFVATDNIGIFEKWYSLDGGTNTTYTATVGLFGATGQHYIYAYANDTSGNLGFDYSTFFTNETSQVNVTIVAGAGVCRYSKLLYYNPSLSWIHQSNCIIEPKKLLYENRINKEGS